MTGGQGVVGDLELLAEGLSFPTSVALDDRAVVYVAESGLPFGGGPRGGRIWRLEPGGGRSLLADHLSEPVNGLAFHEGSWYVSEGGCGRILRIDPDGERFVVLDDLPGPGNYHTNMVAFGPDRKLYFSQGAMTNTGIVGLDAYELGWLRRLPHAHDIPGYDLVLTGFNARTPNPLAPAPQTVETGAFVPFGTPTHPGQSIPAALPCTAAVMRCNPDGTALELVAWGLRNAYGLLFLPDGRLLATDQGADDRGSRAVGDAPDLLVEVREGAWYGWPDFVGSVPITDAQFRPSRSAPPAALLVNHQELPPPEAPLARFPPHVAAVKMDVSPEGALAGRIAVALFGDEAPMTRPAGPPVGRGLVTVGTDDWRLQPFLSGPPLNRPIDVRFHPDGRALYILDFGQFEMDAMGVVARAGTGKLWRLALGGI